MAIFDGLIQILEQVLRFFYGFVHSWGLSIILLTALVRIILLPLTIKQVKSMKAMQVVQPKIKEMQKKYKNDKERLNREMMKFYQENKVNPLGGCLPLLLQLPVFFALFRMLNAASFLKGAPFLWMSSLSKPDPIYILPILMVITTFWSQKQVTPDDPTQKQMLYIMPLFLGFISFRFASGILIYWVTTNIWTIGQQYLTLAPGMKPAKSDESKKSGPEAKK